LLSLVEGPRLTHTCTCTEWHSSLSCATCTSFSRHWRIYVSLRGSNLVELHSYCTSRMNNKYVRFWTQHETYVRKLKYNAGRFELEVFVNCKIQDDCDCILQLTGASGPKHPAWYATVCVLLRNTFVVHPGWEGVMHTAHQRSYLLSHFEAVTKTLAS